MSAIGTWVIKMQTPMGEQEATLQLNEDNTGTMNSMMGEVVLDEVTYTGGDVTFSASLGPMTMEFSGTADGDSLSGEAKSPMGDSPVTGIRA